MEILTKVIFRFVFGLTLYMSMSVPLLAQSIIHSGTIVYERKINMHKMIEDRDGGGYQGWITEYKKSNPKYEIRNYELYFNDTASMYVTSKTQPQTEMRMGGGRFGSMRSNDETDVIYSNLNKRNIAATLSLYELTALIKDSMQTAPWKITNEFKQFLGYNCRKATTVLFDSIFVIAYYTEAIAPSIGPKFYNGLPGGILCVHIPRTYTTYIAKEIIEDGSNQEKIVAPTKGTSYTYKSLIEQLNNTSRGNNRDSRWRKKLIEGAFL